MYLHSSQNKGSIKPCQKLKTNKGFKTVILRRWGKTRKVSFINPVDKSNEDTIGKVCEMEVFMLLSLYLAHAAENEL